MELKIENISELRTPNSELRTFNTKLRALNLQSRNLPLVSEFYKFNLVTLSLL